MVLCVHFGEQIVYANEENTGQDRSIIGHGFTETTNIWITGKTSPL